MKRVLIAVGFVLAAFAGASAQQGPPRPPDGTYVYAWNQNGAVAGRSTVVVSASGGVMTVKVDTNLTTNALAGATIAVGSALDLQSYHGYLSSGGLNTSIDLKSIDRAIVGTIKNASVSYPVNVALFGSAAVIAVDDGTIGSFPLLPAQINARNASSFQLISTANGNASSVPFSVSRSGPYPAGIPTTDAIASLALNVTLWYNPRTFVVDQIARGGLVATLIGRH